MKKVLLAAFAAAALYPAAAEAQFCAPSDPVGFYACASASLSFDQTAQEITMSVQNLGAWDDLAMTSPASGYGWLLVGIGFTGDPSIAGYLDGSLTVAGDGDVFEASGDGDPSTFWSFTTSLSGNISVDAGGTEGPGQDGAILGCQPAGSPDSYFKTCGDDGYPGFVNFTFGTTGLTQATFAASDYTFGMRGIAGPEDVSFKCGTDDGERDCREVPEPMTVLLMGTGLVGLGLIGRRRKEEEEV